MGSRMDGGRRSRSGGAGISRFPLLPREVYTLIWPMKKDQIEEGKISEHSRGLGTPTPEMVRERARELAEINGRSPDQVLESDLEEAWRELTGRGDAPHEEQDSDTIIASSQWDPAPGTPGTRAHRYPAHDEQTDVEKLTQEGVEEAEHDQMVEGAESSLREEEE